MNTDTESKQAAAEVVVSANPKGCQYVRDHYGVPAEIGRRVTVYGKPGIIAEDCGHYIGVNFDAAKPGVVMNCHPTDEVVYLPEMGTVRKPSRSAERYQRYLRVADLFDSFLAFCRWDVLPEWEKYPRKSAWD